MRTRTTATVLVLLSLGLVGLAGCGGDSQSEETTQASTAASTPAPTTATTSPPGTASVPSTAAANALGDESLPPQDAVPGVRVGASRTIDTAEAFVDVLYQDGDPAKPAATDRLEEAGFDGAIIRDQVGTQPEAGLALLRTYAIRLRDEDAARKEVDDAVDEVRSSSAARTSDLEIAGIPDAQGLRVDVDQGQVTGAVVFVTFPVGNVVYGLQGVATTGGAIPQDEMIGAARDLATKVGATP